MCTDTDPEGARLPMVQVRVWDPAAPEMAQPVTGVVMDHTTPDPAGPGGRGSVMTTPVAVPLELLATVTVKPMLVPAETLGASAVLVMVRVTGFTTMVAEADTVGALVEVAVAVFGYMPAEADVVALVTWTANDAPGASDTAEQVRVWPGALPVMAQPPGPVTMDQLTPDPPGRGS